MTSMPAQAAVTSGQAKGGAGGASCDLNFSCTTFKQTCQLGPTNDIDASVRAAAVGGQPHVITWQATIPVVRQNLLMVVSFTVGCRSIGLPALIPNGATIVFPPGTAYVGVFPVDYGWASLTWTLH